MSRHGEDPAGAVRLLDDAVRDLDLRADPERGLGPHDPGGERARDGDRLEGGARLVGESDRAVHARPGGRLLDPVGVHARPVRHRQQIAVARVHHDRGRALGLVGAPHPAQHLLGAVLEREVERQAQVLPGVAVLQLVQRHRGRRARPSRCAARRRRRAAPRRAAARRPDRPTLSTPTDPTTCAAFSPSG